MRQATIRALEICNEADITRGMSRGDLEARILDADRAQASALPDVSRRLQLTAQAEADTWQHAADAATRHDHAQAANAQALASRIAAERQQLEAADARYEEWSAATASTRETAAWAKAELERRGFARPPAGQQQPDPGSEPPTTAGTTAGWWQQFEADLAAAERALEREHQAAIAAGDPWPPRRTAQLKPNSQASVSVDLDPGGPAARLDKLLSRVGGAAERLAADNAEQEARAQYVARIEREARAELEPTLQAQDQAEAEP
jgi:hypothetical protein